jgi:hypothetical protein
MAAVAAIAMTTLACGSLWNLANRGSLAADVHEAIGIDQASLPLKCQMIGSTRSGYCRGEFAEVQAEGIAARLGLNASTVDLQDAASVPPLAYEGEVGCLDEDVLPGVNGLPVWWVDGRPPGLALASGAQFEYLFVVLDPVSGVGCIQVSYSYG